MDFTIPGRVAALLPQLREFVAERLFPLEEVFFREGFGEVASALEDVREAVREKGWWLPHLPESEGGMGLDLLQFGLVAAELGQSPLGHYAFNCQAPDAGNMEVLRELATPAQREEFLAPLLEGKTRSCFSMTEPDHPGSNPVWLGTKATREGSDYVIEGRKWFTSSADGAAFAIVMAVTDPDAPAHKRASMILVPTDSDGFEIVRNIPCMGHQGEGWASHSEIRYRQCRVPISHRLGSEGEGFVIAQRRLGPGRIHHCMRWLGICERSFGLMCTRAASREIRPGVTLGNQQTIQDWIATSRMAIDSARLSVLEAAWRLEKGGLSEARDRISAIKFQVARVMQEVVDRAIQVHGAAGITDDLPLAFFYRTERAARIYDGPDEVHKIALAKRILRGFSHGARPPRS